MQKIIQWLTFVLGLTSVILLTILLCRKPSKEIAIVDKPGKKINNSIPDKAERGDTLSIPIEQAKEGHKDYMDNQVFDTITAGAYFKTAEREAYTNVFNTYAATHTPKGFKWEISYSPMAVHDTTKRRRLSICMLPALVTEDFKKTYIYFDVCDSNDNSLTDIKQAFADFNTYFTTKIETGTTKYKSFVYDEINLWP